MALDKLVDSVQLDANLTSVANAIRTKGGTSASFTFPQGFVDAVDAIQTGGGGGYALADIVSGAEPSGAVDISGMTYRDNAFTSCQNITSLTGTLVGNVAGYLASSCRGLITVNLHFTGSPGSVNYFQYCTSLKTCVFRVDGNNGVMGVCNSCTDLEKADFTVNQLRINTFLNCAKIEELILRSNTITTLENVGVFGGSVFASGKAGGTIRIPKALYDHLGDGSSLDYKAATNWSTINSYGTITWAAIEGSIYETQYADGTPIT